MARQTRTAVRPATDTRAPGRTPRRTEHPMPGVKPHVPHPKARGRLGSQQVVSVRGRRVASTPQAQSRFSSLSQIALPLLFVGIALAMVLSGVATSQTFTIQQLQSQERDLANQVESLNRDFEQRRSAAHIAERAEAAGMVVPAEPGIVTVDAEGHAEERQPFNPEASAKLADVNGDAIGKARASSDDKATSELGDSLTQRPGGRTLGANQPGQPAQPAPQQFANVAPYQSNAAARP